MPGRYTLSVPDDKEIYQRFSITNTLREYTPRYNIAPGQENPIIFTENTKIIATMIWGLVPHWANQDIVQYNTINARAEGIEDKPVFKKPFHFQRCLVPATGYYEWDQSKKPRIPYYLTVKNAPLFAFAGLYDIWVSVKTGKEICSYTIITIEPNEKIAKIHHRMPVILQKEDEDFWLNPDIVDPKQLHPLLKPFPADQMEMYPVSTKVNSPSLDTRELIERQEQNSLF